MRWRNDRIGEVRINNFGSKMIIISYRKAIDIDVYFPEYNWKVKTSYNNFLKGELKCPYETRIYGIGFLGEGEYKARENGKITKVYDYWKGMLKRCYDPYYINRELAYIDTIVCKEWHNFQNFAEWFYDNYYECNNERMELDKDILCKGNKIYSPENCIFVPNRINTLFIKMLNSSDRNGLIGTQDLNNGKYVWQCGYIDELGERKRARGTCNSEEEAFEAYKTFKENYIKQVADEYEKLIPRELYKAMYEYEVEIDD